MLRAVGAALALFLGVLLPLPGGGSGVPRVETPSVKGDRVMVSIDSGVVRAHPEAPDDVVPPRFPHFVRRLDAVGPEIHRRRPTWTPERELLLSFDDGPELDTTPVILDELDRRGLKAIFFVTGQHMVGQKPAAMAGRDLVRKIASHGHLVANHTLGHANLCKNPGLITREVDGNQEILTAATGVRPLLFRSPYGASCHALEEALAARDLVQVGWNIDPQEWRGGGDSASNILAYVIDKLNKLPSKGILLLHDTHPQAARALPRILDWIEAENRRAQAGQARPIRIVDYTVFFPKKPLPPTGVEVALAELGRRMAILPGLGAVTARLGL